jgi:putative ABC transport system permease protein
MLKSYLKIAYRNLISKKGFSIINIIGLSIGMTCCLIIFQFVAFEYSFDRFHENKDNVYRVLQAYAKTGDKMDRGHAFTAQALAPALKESVPEIVNISRVHGDEAVVSNAAQPNNVFEETAILYVDPAFMRMFSFPARDTDGATVLASGQALITESAAMKYFSTANAVGQVLEMAGAVQKSFVVGGVLHDVPANSHLQFNILLPMEDLLKSPSYATEPENGWSWNNFSTYVQFRDDASILQAEKKMTDVLMKHRGDAYHQSGGRGALHAQRLTDLHLNSEVMGTGVSVSGSYRTVYFFLVIGCITLVIALVNYINLATARAVNRSREVGVRKVVGAKRGQLVVQFLAESAITNTVAAIIALALTSVLIPMVNDIAEIRLTTALWLNPGFWMAFSLTLITGTLLAGLYPAFVLSSFKPSTVLKGRAGYMAQHLWLRRGLVIVQFAASIVLVAGTATVHNQLSFMRRMDIGLDLDRVVTIPTPRVLRENVDRPTAMRTFLHELNEISGVQQAALSSSMPGRGFNWNGAAMRKAADDPSNAIRGVATYIDSGFASLYGLKLVAGQEFKDITLSNDADAPWTIIINETASKSLGFATPADAVDELLDVGGHQARVLGVYKDFRWTSAHEEQQNIIFGLTQSGRYVSVRMSGDELPATLDKAQGIFTDLFPGNVFSYAFADEAFDQQYRNEQRFAKLFSIAAGMAIFIACLGLFGLVAFTAQQRTKEIGMRKVLGATVPDIVTLLSMDFLKLVLIGFVLAVPVTWYTMNQWLQNFAYRTEIGFGILVFAGTASIVIAFLTVGWQALKAAMANPVNSLKHE